MPKIFLDLPQVPDFNEGIRRAPKRQLSLTASEERLAVENALRYVPARFHSTLLPEFLSELRTLGRIYAFRYRPQGRIFAKPVDEYQAHTLEGRAFQLMMDNNLDFDIALYPYELVTYGETGQVCQNWLQYHWIRYFLSTMTDEQTLVIQSGHPLGLFKSAKTSSRVVITNGLMVGMFDHSQGFARAAALGVANYGQMTAGGWMYIGPQGIVHGTYNTLVLAGRKRLGIDLNSNLAGRLFVSSGLGGMSGAQGKAAVIAGCVAIVAEVDPSRVETRLSQGWVDRVASTPAQAFSEAREAQSKGEALAIAFQGNVVDLLDYAVDKKVSIDLLSDQTSCHAVYEGGYLPQGMSFQERTRLLAENKENFVAAVKRGLRRHFSAIRTLTERGTYFFDYGNSFMKAVFDAGEKAIVKNGVDELDGFIWPSYIEDLMGPELFDYGYGPFRWVCLSGKDEDLRVTDHVAAEEIRKLRNPLRYQDVDNLNWILAAEKNRLVVGSKARILYQDARGRQALALAFNALVRDGRVGPIMLGRDHHDTGGTDSPFRETSNIKDGSNVMADMATQSFAGNATRGMSLVALHNGGGVGVSKSINGGFGLVLDGSLRVDEIISSAMQWDVMVGVSRRAWARNSNAIAACREIADFTDSGSEFLLPELVDPESWTLISK